MMLEAMVEVENPIRWKVILLSFMLMTLKPFMMHSTFISPYTSDGMDLIIT